MDLWKMQLRAASFRGVSFGVTADESEGGRRTVTHEFPQREAPYVEDLGGAPRRFTVQAFVLGRDYMSRRDALEAALQQPGPGTLVHPWYGEVQVSQTAPYKVRHSAQDGGMAVFQLFFCRDTEPNSPAASVNQGLRARLEAGTAGLLACDSFDSVLRLAGQAEWAVSQTYSLIVDAVSTVQAIMHGDVSTVADLLGAATGYDLMPLASVGQHLWSVLQDIGGQSGLSDAAVSGRWASVARTDFLQTVPDNVGSQRAVIQSNGQAVESLVRRLALVESARAATTAQPASRSEAQQLRYDFLDAMDEVSALEPVIPDMTQASSVSRTEIRLAASLASLRSGALATLAEAARRAPEVVTITPACVLPSLALCYRQSGGVDLEADLVARNRLIHPGFVPVEPLEVLRG